MLATALQLVLVMAALHLMALRHRLMSIFDPVDMINMPHLTHAYSNHYVLPPFFLFSVFESLICHGQNLDDGSSSVSNHDGAWKFGVCNTSRLRILIRYTHLRRIIIPDNRKTDRGSADKLLLLHIFGVFYCSINFGFESFLFRTQVEGLLLTLTGVKTCARLTSEYL